MGSPGARRLAAPLSRWALGVPGDTIARTGSALRRLFGLAQGYVDAGDFDRARRPLASALEINDRAWRPQLILARIYDAEGEPDLSQRTPFAAPAATGRSKPKSRMTMACFSIVRRVTRMPLSPFAGPRRMRFPCPRRGFENLGLALEGAEAPEAARDAFQRALALTPCAQRPLLALTRWYLTEGDIPRARSLAERFARCAPDNEESLALALAIARRLGDPKAEAEASRRLEVLGASAP